jgi:metalloendopeptidase pepO
MHIIQTSYNYDMMNLKHLIPALAFAVTGASAQTTDLKSGLDRNDMDLSIKPGTNFFDYAGGNWRKSHPIPAEYSRYGSFEVLIENNERQLHDLIEQLAKESHPAGSLEQKIGDLYNLAMDSTRRNREGWTPIKGQLEQVAAVKTLKDLTILSGQLGRYGVESYFGIGVGSDMKDSKMNIVGIQQGGLSLGNRDYYLENDEATQKIREAYKQYIVKMFRLVGDDEATAQKKMEAVFNIEMRIAKASKSMVELRDPEANYHKMTFNQLLNDYPGIDWSTLLLCSGFPAISCVDMGQPENIREIEKLMADTPIEDQKAYMAFKVIENASGQLSDDFRNATFDFYGRVMSGTTQDRARWKRAIGAVQGVLGEAVGKMYVEKYFPASSKERMIQLVRNLQKSLGERIKEQKWMSKETQEKALEKLNTFYVKIGYPDTWMDYSGLTIDPSKSYFENLCQASAFITDYYIQKDVNKPVDRTRWQMTPQTINAYYNPTTNEICFPAGILQPPFFNPEADDAANYGAIGVVIGHEMTHGFDDQGSQFDKDGNLKNWWTEADRKNFEARTKVMADFFSKIEVLPGLYANGQLTLGENIADHGGLNIAFQAFKEATAANPLPEKDGFTPEQRFFLAYAKVWIDNIRDEEIRNRTKNDPHSLGRWRVNGALPHIDAWYKAFNIGKKDPLYVPAKQRVDVW